MTSFLVYVVIADIITMLFFIIGLSNDPDNELERALTANSLPLALTAGIGVLLGFILLPVAIVQRIQKRED